MHHKKTLSRSNSEGLPITMDLITKNPIFAV